MDARVLEPPARAVDEKPRRQRVPVRVLLDGEAGDLGKLRPGLLVTASIDRRQVRKKNAPKGQSATRPPRPMPQWPQSMRRSGQPLKPGSHGMMRIPFKQTHADAD
jgi:hypothetical protein